MSNNEQTRRLVAVGAAPAPPGSGMPRLVVLLGSEPGRRYALDQASYVLGRGDECDIRLDDAKVSRRHAVLQQVGAGRWCIEDLGSRNGTLVDGERIDTHVLQVGERVQLSNDTLLLFTRHDPMEDLIFHRQQMEVIGQLAAGIAHDFNNLLNVILGGAWMLEALPPETPLGDPEPTECRRDIIAAAEQAAALTDRLIGLARRRERSVPTHPVCVTEVCEDVVRLASRTFDRSIQIRVDVAGDLSILGDGPSLHQLLMNLCLNARDAMPDGGELTLVARSEPTEGGGPGQVVLEVSDTGVGMDAETQSRIFEPFYTTKEGAGGSGLGLATAFQIVNTHYGTIEVESEPDKGTCFRIRLPAVAAAEHAAEAHRQKRITRSTPPLGASGGAPSVLVVDDQPLVRRTLARILRRGGFDVETAEHGLQALDAYREAPTDLVLLDLDMPEMNGEEALSALLAHDPNARVLLLSGLHDESRRERLLRAGALAFLAKPISPVALRTELRLALGEDTAGAERDDDRAAG